MCLVLDQATRANKLIRIPGKLIPIEQTIVARIYDKPQVVRLVSSTSADLINREAINIKYFEHSGINIFYTEAFFLLYAVIRFYDRFEKSPNDASP